MKKGPKDCAPDPLDVSRRSVQHQPGEMAEPSACGQSRWCVPCDQSTRLRCLPGLWLESNSLILVVQIDFVPGPDAEFHFLTKGI
jgi:hypothetical protein